MKEIPKISSVELRYIMAVENEEHHKCEVEEEVLKIGGEKVNVGARKEIAEKNQTRRGKS